MKLDVIVFAAHPDDAELSMGGTIAKLADSGLKIGIIDLTLGEMSTRGTVEKRNLETASASEILKISLRKNLGFVDGSIKPINDYLLQIITQIRKHQPEIIFAPYWNDRHPDHIGASQLIKEAMFKSGLQKIETLDDNKVQVHYRPKRLFYFMQTYEFTPSFIVDITDTFETKMKSIYAYDSQFYDPSSHEAPTFISDPKFLKYIEARARYFGFKIGKEYGEAFFCEEFIEMDIANLVNKGGQL
ncbi:MAG: bacillithiol biosynthesis deacetylase BshB1 [Melioribacteraceae bacterium]|jgi:bacillithiol biosynthesis deacetylase BshB1|nr:bacillithiol biosynthesis deacetylase BshB1 [Melioribacteraceae bacterium]